MYIGVVWEGFALCQVHAMHRAMLRASGAATDCGRRGECAREAVAAAASAPAATAALARVRPAALAKGMRSGHWRAGGLPDAGRCWRARALPVQWRCWEVSRQYA